MYDARQFILNHKLVIEMAPLQVYSSALLFSLARVLFDTALSLFRELVSSVFRDMNIMAAIVLPFL